MASEYSKKDGLIVPIGGKADIIDGKLLKPDSWYIVEGGEWVEVDYTNDLFTYVISSKKDYKKVKTIDGEELFIAFDKESGKAAHGETLKEALQNNIL